MTASGARPVGGPGPRGSPTGMLDKSGTLLPEHSAARAGGISASVAMFSVVTVVLTIVLLEAGLRPSRADGLGWASLALGLGEHALQAAVPLIAAGFVLRRVTTSDFGFRRPSWRTALTSTATLYAAYLVVTGVVVAIVGAPPEKGGARALGHVDSTGLLVGFAIVSCVVAPVTEELLFRGVLYAGLRQRLRPAAAVLGAGALFGLLHGPPWGAAVQLSLLGCALCVIYERCGSIVPCVGAHAAHNCIAFAAAAALSPAWAVALTFGSVGGVLLGGVWIAPATTASALHPSSLRESTAAGRRSAVSRGL
jgi:membrane protease YdiL (CAAX protease family)